MAITFRGSTESTGDAFIPKRYRDGMKAYLDRVGIQQVPYFSFGIVAYITIILSFLIDILLIVSPFFSNFPIYFKILISIFIIPILFIVIRELLSFFYRLFIDAQFQYIVYKMEEKFHEFLTVLALNLRSGQTLDEALENSLEKEFGVLSREVGKMVQHIKLGKEIGEAIREFTNKYNSPMIDESFELILLSWKKGANTANLVERLQNNLKVNKFLKEKIIASVTNYRIFLTLLGIIVAPAMFALAFHLIKLIRDIANKVLTDAGDIVLPIAIESIRINDQAFILFSNIITVLIAVSIAIIIAGVKASKGKEAYTLIFIYGLLSFIAYQLFVWLFGIFFGIFVI